MASRYWMITNRKPEGSGEKRTLGKDEGARRLFTRDLTDAIDDIGNLSSWQEVSEKDFKDALLKAAAQFPALEDVPTNEDQRHVTIFVHGYNNEWRDAARRYWGIVRDLYTGDRGLGECILFTWPSDGMTSSYLPDRRDARRSADDLADVLSQMYDLLAKAQADAARDRPPCRAKTSIIAHSMGAYVVERAMKHVWDRKNQPLLVSFINQLLMVDADVDNDIFSFGENVTDESGEGIANLAYRVTALYTGLDAVLGVSAGLKHFGKRRLGRSGLDKRRELPDNVWDIDMTSLFDPAKKKEYGNYHSAAFQDPKTLELMRQVLRGVDRRILVANGTAPRTEAIAVAPVASEGLAPPAQG